MKRIFKEYINETFEDGRALVEITNNNEVIFEGDYYHDKIGSQIDGFFTALKYLKVQYELLDEEVISPEHELFDYVGFYNNN